MTIQSCKTIGRYFIFIIACIFSLASYSASAHDITTIKILGINDFHGQVSMGRRMNGRPIGGAAVMTSYLRQSQAESDSTLITLMGDQVGASSPVSGLLHDEPTIMYLNMLANVHCSKETRMDAECNLVATVGNHEFDKGQSAMFGLIYGTNLPPTDGWLPMSSYPGAVYPYISANIVNEKTGKLLFPPYVIKKVKGISVAFIGAITKNAPDVILNKNIDGVTFLDEADAINRFIPEIRAQGAKIIVVLIHEGGMQSPYEGDTKDNGAVEGRIVDIVNRLDDSVDVVMAGHVHQFVNAMLANQHGKKILVTEAGSYSTAFAEVTLNVDKQNLTVHDKSARVIYTYADQAPGDSPDMNVAKLVKLAEDKVKPKVERQVGTLVNTLEKNGNADGESTLGNLLTDAYRSAMQSDMAIYNNGGIRSDLYAGKVTWGDLFAVQPFSNVVVKLAMSGRDLYALLEQQWRPGKTDILQISGFSYVHDVSKPIGQRIVSITFNGKPLQQDRLYSVATNNFLAAGGDGFSVFKNAKVTGLGGVDLDELVRYVEKLPQPFSITTDGRIRAQS